MVFYGIFNMILKEYIATKHNLTFIEGYLFFYFWNSFTRKIKVQIFFTIIELSTNHNSK